MSVNKFKVGDVVKCVDSGIFNNLTVGKDYVDSYIWVWIVECSIVLVVGFDYYMSV